VASSLSFAAWEMKHIILFRATKAAQDHLIAYQPCSTEGIAHGILDQCSGATRENVQRLTRQAINHGLSFGWLTEYDGMQGSYELKH
jgi:hypothetical protein